MDGPEPPVVNLEYTPSEDLHPLEDPSRASKGLLDQLKSKDWLETFNGLTTLRRIIKFHPELVSDSLGELIQAVLKAIKSPRSALSKGGLMAAGDLFRSCSSSMIDHLDNLLLPLLLKASQNQKFLGEEAERALSAMALHLPSAQVLKHLEPFCKHANPRVRAKATVSYGQCAALLPPTELTYEALETLLRVAAKQVSDQLPESREAARKLAVHLRAVFPDVPQPSGAPQADGNGEQTSEAPQTTASGAPQAYPSVGQSADAVAAEEGGGQKRHGQPQEPNESQRGAVRVWK